MADRHCNLPLTLFCASAMEQGQGRTVGNAVIDLGKFKHREVDLREFVG